MVAVARLSRGRALRTFISQYQFGLSLGMPGCEGGAKDSFVLPQPESAPAVRRNGNGGVTPWPQYTEVDDHERDGMWPKWVAVQRQWMRENCAKKHGGA
jgi:hypothetical protein